MKRLFAILAVLLLVLTGCAGEGEVPTLPPEYLYPGISGNHWVFSLELEAAGEPLTAQKMEIHQYYQDGTMEPVMFDQTQLAYMGLTTLNPDENLLWHLTHPVSESLGVIAVHITFHAGAGKTMVQSFYFSLDQSVPAQIGGNQPVSGQFKVLSDTTVGLEPIYEGNDWHFQMILENPTDQPLQPIALVIERYSNGQPYGEPIGFYNDEMQKVQLGGCVVEPGSTYIWDDWHPIVPDFNHIEYFFTLVTPDGNHVLQRFVFHMSGDVPVPQAEDRSQDEGKDLLTLRHEADFEVQVAQGVYWVNASSLGKSRYTNGEIYALLPASPEEKAEKISTVYEALQLYQVGGFYSSDDNVRIMENDVFWEHHKPGYDAVRTNTGCCATDSNWLNYILRDDYQEIGYIATSQRDGSGHIYNYIYHEGFYYFIDLTHYRTDWVATAMETGNLDDYYRSDFVLGNIHKAESVEAFVRYVQAEFPDPPGMMFRYRAENCLAIDSPMRNGKIVILYGIDPQVNVEIIFDDPQDNLVAEFVPSPENLPNWEELPDYSFPNP